MSACLCMYSSMCVYWWRSVIMYLWVILCVQGCGCLYHEHIMHWTVCSFGIIRWNFTLIVLLFSYLRQSFLISPRVKQNSVRSRSRSCKVTRRGHIMGLYFPPFMGLFLPLWHLNEILKSTEKAISIVKVIFHLNHSLSFGKLKDKWPKKVKMGKSSPRKCADGFLTCFLFIVMEIVVPQW